MYAQVNKIKIIINKRNSGKNKINTKTYWWKKMSRNLISSNRNQKKAWANILNIDQISEWESCQT
jgi:hypothetical protein